MVLLDELTGITEVYGVFDGVVGYFCLLFQKGS
jgi:hypothetical protein